MLVCSISSYLSCFPEQLEVFLSFLQSDFYKLSKPNISSYLPFYSILLYVFKVLVAYMHFGSKALFLTTFLGNTQESKVLLVQSRVSQPQQYGRLGWDNSLLSGGCPVYCRLFTNIPGLTPLDASSTLSPVLTIRFSRHCQIPPGERKHLTSRLRSTV